MTPPTLTPPTLLTPTDLKRSPILASCIVDLVNAAFRRTWAREPEKWHTERARFPSTQSLLDALGEQGTVAVICDAADKEGEGDAMGRVVACAAAVPWNGPFGVKVEGRQSEEEGWEIKVVCVDGAERYLKTGLADRLVAFYGSYLTVRARESIRGSQRSGVSGQVVSGEVVNGEVANGKVTLWFLVAESLNGAYWRKKGCVEVRRRTAEPGVWGCKHPFELLVLKRDIDFEI
ncbi:hypothetical protein BS50DRAFT_569998 [Corynespora cassiicola Philippines]|uniref:N-acetyltransferase domain-containing protein n=1 Tax=Corynespora cassiicola Philippines TaxID=1448308 RepID=A0A2T2P4C3_CORCC|nr:hypothetical protein BS50DRAFT_569998 [Corynespora cassiicola Philippines]